MSLYSIHKICFQVRTDAAFEDRLRTDPAAVVDEYDLEPHERAALLAGDVRRLHDLGVNAFFLGSLRNRGLFGLTAEEYRARIRGETSAET